MLFAFPPTKAGNTVKALLLSLHSLKWKKITRIRRNPMKAFGIIVTDRLYTHSGSIKEAFNARGY